MVGVDLDRLAAVKDSLKEEFPAHRVSTSWVFRYALYRLSVDRGLEARAGPFRVVGEVSG